MPMADLARTDEYDPFEAEKFANPAVRDIIGSLATLPQRAIQNSQFAVDTGVYDPAVPVEAAMTVMGGGVGGTGAKAGETALTAGYDPKLWHGVSTIKLPKPIEEMSSVLRPVNPAAETVINPAKLQGSLLMPLLGDRTASAALLDQVNGYKLANPVSLEGGHGYMANNPGMAWAAGKSIAPGIARVAREAAESGVPVHGVYTAMGERSADFSHMVSDTLAEMAKHTKITPEGEALFNETMRKVSPGFPGIHSPEVAQYLRDAPGAVRNVFAKTMDTAPMQKHGFPSVAEARVAVTDPRLLNEPTGAAGLSIARMDPEGRLGPSGHGTYDTGIRGNYVAGLPASVPKEVMFSDILNPLSKHADAVAQARVDAGLKPFRPTEDYLMGRMPKGLPKVQEANQQWVDSVSQNLLDRGFTLGSGATDKKGAAAIQGIRAYHSSPHDFDRFDLSKIGTGEGAQVYGHGLYFAENPAVSGQGGQYWQQFVKKFGGSEQEAAARLQKHDFDRAKAIEDARKWAVDAKEHFNMAGTPLAERAVGHYEDVLRRLESGAPVGPRTYEVNINADPVQMLNWDKSMSAQPEVMNKIRPLFSEYRLAPSNYLGESVHKEIRDFHMGHGMSKPAAAEAAAIDLRSAGIPGIKYLDEGSRGQSSPYLVQKMLDEAKAGLAAAPKDKIDWHTRNVDLHERMLKDALRPSTSNYVVFDPSIVDIMKKYGIAGAAPAGMGALAAQDYYRNP